MIADLDKSIIGRRIELVEALNLLVAHAPRIPVGARGAIVAVGPDWTALPSQPILYSIQLEKNWWIVYVRASHFKLVSLELDA